jgi:hypothetical protein
MEEGTDREGQRKLEDDSGKEDIVEAGEGLHVKGELVTSGKVLRRERSVVLGLTSRDLGASESQNQSWWSATKPSSEHRREANERTYSDSDPRQHVVHEDVVDVILADKVPNKHPRLFNFSIRCHALPSQANARLPRRSRDRIKLDRPLVLLCSSSILLIPPRSTGQPFLADDLRLGG